MPVGYKQTDVGVIPEDWKVKSIADIATIDGGYAFSSKNFLSSGKYQVVKMSNVYGGTLNLDRSTSYLNNLDELEEKYLLKQDDILLTLTGTTGKRDYGYSYKINKEKNLLLNQRIARLITNKSISPDYVAFQLKMPCFLEQFFDSSKGGTGNQTNLGTQDVAAIYIPLPPTLTEQTAIATALSDVDALLNQLDKLIAKKRDIKQATMQQLLTGKKRLAGFSGEWEVKKLGDVCWYQEGPGLRQWQFTKRGMKVINVTNLENGILNLDRTDRHISMNEFSKMYQHFAVDPDDIVMASSGNSYGKAAIVRKQDLPLVMNTSVIRFKPLKNLNYHFLWIFLNSDSFKEQIDLMITGGAQPNFGPFHLNKIELCIPSIEEQTAIATLLTDMDNEISQLQQRRHKTQALKQGMMQQLLTGKIRLI